VEENWQEKDDTVLPFLGLRPWTRRRCVGVIGLLQSGKTVLLTSLIDHLKKHDPARFPLAGRHTGLVEIETCPPATGAERFDYTACRSRLGNRQWPFKTCTFSEYRALYVRDDWRYTKIDLSLLDIPGERLADLAIAHHRRFEDWSDAILDALRIAPEFATAAMPFFAYLDETAGKPDTAVDPALLLHTYRLTLARLIEAYMPLVTPSSFLIDADGNYVAEDIVRLVDAERRSDALAARQISGLSQEMQFAPLPQDVRRAHPALTARFAAHYTRYRQRLVLPFARALKACDTLVVLVDVAMLLEGGVGTLNASQTLLQHIVAYIDPGFTAAGTLGSWLVHLGTLGLATLAGVRRIVFVATKADRVHQDDRSKLETLLRDLAAPLVRGRQAVRSLRIDYVVCAAVNSTRSEIEAQRHVLQFVSPHGTTVRQNVPWLPTGWPDHWEPTNYTFPSPPPWMPANRANPPEHINLHWIAAAVLS
jgi:predicted YcjX-like family ATPase